MACARLYSQSRTSPPSDVSLFEQFFFIVICGYSGGDGRNSDAGCCTLMVISNLRFEYPCKKLTDFAVVNYRSSISFSSTFRHSFRQLSFNPQSCQMGYKCIIGSFLKFCLYLQINVIYHYIVFHIYISDGESLYSNTCTRRRVEFMFDVSS